MKVWGRSLTARREVPMAKLYMVRHAPVNIDPKVPPSDWQLSNDAQASVKQLVADHAWSDVSHIYYSPEPKAAATAAMMADQLGLATSSCAALREVAMDTGFLPPSLFRQRVARFLNGEPDSAFENYADATSRIVNAIASILEAAPKTSVAAVSHGRILTVFYSYLLGHRLGANEWQSIALPDLSIVNLTTSTVDSGFFAGNRVVNLPRIL